MRTTRMMVPESLQARQLAANCGLTEMTSLRRVRLLWQYKTTGLSRYNEET
jgi:hypothetical protein